MADLIAGAAVGLIFSELYKAVDNLIQKNKKFAKHLEAIKATVDSLKPMIDRMVKQNEELNFSNEETEKLKKIISAGKELVRNFSKNPKWYKNASYTKELTKLDEDLKSQLEILKVRGLSDGMETLIIVTKIEKLINHLQASLLQASWLLLVLIIFVIWVSRVMFGVPGGVRKQQLATSSASVPHDGIIFIVFGPPRLPLGYLAVWLFGRVLVIWLFAKLLCISIDWVWPA
ncbi:uncharacterized protein Pyn_26131 [Prunus yedoensis var. nudiflora]|uniref:RPW8 domain-containing protein n=1 Tax=Prunus yedoensis var. nudiflora TaxID=2094558 RepID=A0A314Z8V7_PRUYE|nr:uncharacterized protein Pyn_26131 [Prunus yedoensis var. nudiflora]